MAKPRFQSIAARGIAGEPAGVKRLSAARVRRTLGRILRKSPLCAMATVAPDGRAHVNTAYFAWSASLDIYFLSHPDSVHCRNLKARASMAIAVYESGQTWGALDRGVQLFGTCRETRGASAKAAERAYAKRFRAYAEWNAELEEDDAAHDYRFYRFVPQRVKVFDEREFGGAVFVTARVTAASAPRRRRALRPPR